MVELLMFHLNSEVLLLYVTSTYVFFVLSVVFDAVLACTNFFFPLPICFQMHQLLKDICTSFYDSTTCFHLRQEIYSWIQQPLWGSGVEMVSHELKSQENDFRFIWNAAYFSIVLVVFLGHSGLSSGTAELLDLSYCI